MQAYQALESKDNLKALVYWAGAKIKFNYIVSEYEKESTFTELLKKHQSNKGKNANKKRIEKFDEAKRSLKRFWQENVNPKSRPTTAANKIIKSDVYERVKPQPMHSTLVKETLNKLLRLDKIQIT